MFPTAPDPVLFAVFDPEATAHHGASVTQGSSESCMKTDMDHLSNLRCEIMEGETKTSEDDKL